MGRTLNKNDATGSDWMKNQFIIYIFNENIQTSHLDLYNIYDQYYVHWGGRGR